MRLAASVPATWLLAWGVLAAGCATTEKAASRAADHTSAASPVSRTTGQTVCDQRCREERKAERCRQFLSGVRLHYEITAAPAAGGREIGLHMILENRSRAAVQGSTSGLLLVSPRPGANRISWGGSSADELYQNPGTTVRRPVWHDRQPPGWHPVGDRVISFDFSTYAYAPGPGTTACFIPATVRAPRGLVVAHPAGRWTQESSQ